MKKLSLKLLNSEEIKELKGGNNRLVQVTCSGSGDTIICAPFVGKVIACATIEATCPSGFSSDCNLKKVSITCGGGKITLEPK